MCASPRTSRLTSRTWARPSRWAASIRLRAPYYIHLEPPDKSFLAGGVYMPTPDQLAAIRRAIDRDPERLKAAISSKPFKKYFGTLSGEKLKTPPRGYAG